MLNSVNSLNICSDWTVELKGGSNLCKTYSKYEFWKFLRCGSDGMELA